MNGRDILVQKDFSMEEKKHIGQLFDNIAHTYDKFNHVLSLNIDKKWRRKAVRPMAHAEEVLDVAIGTADLTIELLRQGKAKHITGIDLSAEMMKIGVQKVAASGLEDKVCFRQEDALQMSFPDNSFDALTCAYGVRNFSDLDKGLSEFYRVMRPGAEVMILEFSYPNSPIVRLFYDFFFTHIMPVMGGAISKDKKAYVYFKNSVKQFIWGEKMVTRLEKAGFKDCTFKAMSCGISTVYYAKK